MKKFFLISLLSSSLLGCATTQNAPNLTPLAVTQYNLTQLVDAIGILQTSAENAVPANILPVNTAYLTLKNQLSAADLQKFGPYLTSFEIVFNSFGGK